MVSTLDFRRLDDGNKRKNRDEEEEMAVDVKRLAVPSLENPNKPSPLLGRPTFDGVIAGKPSGRRWKIPRTHRSSASQVTRTRTTPEQRAREKEVKRAFRERKEELKEEIRRHNIEMREKREEREKRKKENILRSGTKLQVISNPKTLKKIAKSKYKKLLKVVPDDLVHKVLGHEGDGATEEAKKSNHAVRKLEKRQQGRKLDAHVEGQCGRADGYILEGKELEFYMKKIQRKKGKGGAA